MNKKTSTLIQKHLLSAILGLLISPHCGQAEVSASYDVVTRKKNGSFKIAPRSIEGLKAQDAFETENFRISWKKEETALTLDRIGEIVAAPKTTEEDNPFWVGERDAAAIKLLAANALYHTELARRYFIDILGSEEVGNLEQIVVRLDLTNRFSQYERFAHDNYQPQYNNALSIAGGKPLKPRPGVNPWQREIWFRPEKKIPIAEILALLPENPANAEIRQARSELYPMQLDLGIRNTIYAAFQNRMNNFYLDSMVRQAGTFLLMESAFQVIKLVNRAIIPQTFYLDTAMVPEIIYHEFSHIALSDFMQLDISTPVNEGMADFFAASIAGSPKLAKKIRTYSTAIGKNGAKKQYFQIEHESIDKAQSDFVLSLLWGLRDVFGEKTAVKLVFEARKYITTKGSDIREGLVKALVLSCETVCEAPFRDRLLIRQYLQERGL